MSMIEDTAFSIIGIAGDGRAKVNAALKAAREGKFDMSEKSLEEANELLLKAHRIQTDDLLGKEAAGELTGQPFNVLVAHAQDYIMTGMVMKEMAEEIINLYKLSK